MNASPASPHSPPDCPCRHVTHPSPPANAVNRQPPATPTSPRRDIIPITATIVRFRSTGFNAELPRATAPARRLFGSSDKTLNVAADGPLSDPPLNRSVRPHHAVPGPDE
jgi:hypothetical protein